MLNYKYIYNNKKNLPPLLELLIVLDALLIITVSKVEPLELSPTHALPVLMEPLEPKPQLVSVPPHQSSPSPCCWLPYWLPSSSEKIRYEIFYKTKNIF